MMKRTILLALAFVSAIASAGAQAPKPAPGNPVIVVETVKGTIEIELFAKDAPKTVARLLTLVRQNFYRGQRFHRVEAGFLIQAGDPSTRDFTKRARWGSGGSGQQIGVAEIARAHRHLRGAVGMAHAGRPERADSQFYIMRAALPGLDGKYAIVGRVLSGMDIVDRTELNDMIRKVSVRGEARRP
ncbi:MAG: peptidylprolyl isomerase [Acidobacteriota bacterium]|nr:peptidylprolyl isomerase [Acidobacteriota bacterium]